MSPANEDPSSFLAFLPLKMVYFNTFVLFLFHFVFFLSNPYYFNINKQIYIYLYVCSCNL